MVWPYERETQASAIRTGVSQWFGNRFNEPARTARTLLSCAQVS